MTIALAMLVATLGAGPIAAADAPNGGSISIELAAPADGGVRPPAAFVAGTSDALAAHGFTVLDDPGHSAYVASLAITRVEVGTATAKVAAGRSSAYPAVGGAVGGGVVIPLSTGNSELVPLERVQLELRIRKRGEDKDVWHGTAVTVRAAGTPAGASERVASDLAAAVLRAYPAEPQGVVGVP